MGGWGCSSMVEHLPSMCEVLSSCPTVQIIVITTTKPLFSYKNLNNKGVLFSRTTVPSLVFLCKILTTGPKPFKDNNHKLFKNTLQPEGTRENKQKQANCGEE